MLLIRRRREHLFPRSVAMEIRHFLLEGGQEKPIAAKEAKAMIAGGTAMFETEARRAEEQKTRSHCQVCERLIQAKTGLIAHHGYRRPGMGWQTASCFGARGLPYEESRELIPFAMCVVAEHRERQLELIERLEKSPPRGLELERQEGPFRARYAVCWTALKGSYEYEQTLKRRIWGAQQEVKACETELERLQKRWLAWVAPKKAKRA